MCVLFEKATTNPFPWESLFGAVLELGLVVILVFYLNRWVQRKPTPAGKVEEEIDPECSSIGEAPRVEETGAEKIPLNDEEIVHRGAEN